MAALDPLELLHFKEEGETREELSLSNYGFENSDLDYPVDMSALRQMTTAAPSGFLSGGKLTLRQIHERLTDIYCGSIGYEYVSISLLSSYLSLSLSLSLSV